MLIDEAKKCILKTKLFEKVLWKQWYVWYKATLSFMTINLMFFLYNTVVFMQTTALLCTITYINSFFHPITLLVTSLSHKQEIA